jgi:hypothetical protein
MLRAWLSPWLAVREQAAATASTPAAIMQNAVFLISSANLIIIPVESVWNVD